MEISLPGSALANDSAIRRSLVLLPDSIKVHNASTDRCDVADGPCACGAWHHIVDWPNLERKN